MIPVYLFTGFLESGKTCFILSVLNDPTFNDGSKTLLIVCEEGMTEYDEDYLAEKLNTKIVYVEKMENLNYHLLNQLKEKYDPDQVFIEYNGMWSVSNLFEQVELPMGWDLAQIVSTIDASTFQNYMANMRSIMYEQLVHSDMIIFNRCSENTKKSFLRSNIKAINRSAQIIYESVDGSVNTLPEDEMPFDLNAKVIEVSDDDFGLWYMDAIEHPQKYKGKTVQIKGKAYEPMDDSIADCAFVIGRNAMVCCSEDTQPIGLLCYWEYAGKLAPQEWVQVTGPVDVVFDEDYGEDVPVIKVENLKVVPPLQDELVYFN